MIHARKDYDHIQDTTGKIATDEPVFLLRAKDETAPDALLAWAHALELSGGDKVAIEATRKHAELMIKWQEKNGCKQPDTPEEEVNL